MSLKDRLKQWGDKAHTHGKAVVQLPFTEATRPLAAARARAMSTGFASLRASERRKSHAEAAKRGAFGSVVTPYTDVYCYKVTFPNRFEVHFIRTLGNDNEFDKLFVEVDEEGNAIPSIDLREIDAGTAHRVEDIYTPHDDLANLADPFGPDDEDEPEQPT